MEDSITCSVVAQHCVKAHTQNQWRRSNFDPRQFLNPLNFQLEISRA